MAPTSAGDLLDRMTILELKARLVPPAAADDAAATLARWQEAVGASGLAEAGLDDAIEALRDVNQQLWDAEDRIRADSVMSDAAAIAAIALEIVELNDRRAAIKAEIDAAVGSAIRDAKFYGHRG